MKKSQGLNIFFTFSHSSTNPYKHLALKRFGDGNKPILLKTRTKYIYRPEKNVFFNINFRPFKRMNDKLRKKGHGEWRPLHFLLSVKTPPTFF